MQIGLHVGFGAPVGPAVLEDLRARGCAMVRAQAFVDDFTPTPPDVTHAIAQEVLDAGMLKRTDDEFETILAYGRVDLRNAVHKGS